MSSMPIASNRGFEERRRRVDDDDQDEPSQRPERERLDEPYRHDHARDASDGQPSAARRWKRPAPTNRTPAIVATKAPDPIMIGNAARGSIPRRLNSDEARRVVADPERQQRAQHEIDRERERERPRREGERGAAGREQAEHAEQHERGGRQQRAPHAELHRAA